MCGFECVLCLSGMLIFTCVSWVAFAVALIPANSKRVGVEGTCATRNTAGNILVLANAAFFARPAVFTCAKMCAALSVRA